jgi:lysophospholipid acyltransferase (LPLAT)-like uncharacterized protein
VAGLWTAGTPVIYVVWHARLLVLPYLYRGRDFRVLISRSRDGERVARLVRRFGFVVVRGSSSKGERGASGVSRVRSTKVTAWWWCPTALVARPRRSSRAWSPSHA